jgi:hypothetical protein
MCVCVYARVCGHLCMYGRVSVSVSVRLSELINFLCSL